MIRKYFIAAMILFMLTAPSLSVAQSSEDSASCSEKDAQSLLSAFISYTDLRIQSVLWSLEILTSTKEARSGNWREMQDLLSDYQKSNQGFIVWYVHPDGSYYTVDKGLMDKKLSDRNYFPNLMAGRKITGTLVVSKSTGQRSAIIAVPVKKGGKVVGAVGASLFLDKLAEQINAVLDLRPGISFFALAPNGLTTLHRKTDRHFLDPRELGSNTLKKAATEMLNSTSGKTTYIYDNITKEAIYKTSSLTQWRFAIAFSAALQ
jgi:hypothetical protein